ncbi:MAG: aminoacyl-histidine dipeptidase [Bacteroidetes bacterium]|nr:aminoacyl-histidine dipeptidase [Bacteroidota bacterium]
MKDDMPEQILKNLKPEILWERFYEISRVPRPSKKEGKILEHFKKLLSELNVSYKQDKVGNILASIPATKGYEKSPVVVLQGHVDMVCEKNKNTFHDFDNDPIILKRTDEWITADGTTLGGDNGIGVAAALAVISDKEIIHGPVEILLTVDEETGLTGANNLEKGFLTGKILLNLDSEEDGAFYVGCSGGIDTVGRFILEYEYVNPEYAAYEILVSGLKGGHSGLDINTGRANAIKILARALKELDEFEYEIFSISGGSKRNAIPREAEVVLFVHPSNIKQIEKIISEFYLRLFNEFKVTDGLLKIEFIKSSIPSKKVFSETLKENIINTILALPHGVITMSQDIPDLVETSTNLATVTMANNNLVIGTCQRSSIESAKNYIAQSVEAVFRLAKAEVNNEDAYPGWKPNLDSEILKISKKVFKDLFNKEPEIKAVHAGLECGILGDKEPGLDMISFGPTITGAHSPDEKVNIETVEKFYDLLKGILKYIAEKNK